MIKSGLLSYRTVTSCQVLSRFSLRPYTREQRLIKAIEKQEERLRKEQIHRQTLPLVFQSQLETSSPDSVPSVAAPRSFKAENLPDSPQKQLLDQVSLNRIYNLSDKNTGIVVSTSCAGCGANLHCITPGTHGFLPEPEIMKIKSSEEIQRKHYSPHPVTCVRCKLLAQNERALNETLSSQQYDEQVIGELNRHEKTTILVVADMTNLPHSIVPLRLTNPSAHKVVLIGNKVDQLPVDGPKFHSRWSQVLLESFKQVTGLPSDAVSYIALVSALKGFGIQKLLDFLLSKSFNVYESPVFIVGTTNTGKSSLFNRLLLSDFCKSDARESIHRATVSFWPGTTAGLLKFPLSRMTTVKRALREQAKYTNRHSLKKAIESQFKEVFGYKIIPRDESAQTSLTTSNLDVHAEQVRNNLQDLSLRPTYRFRKDSSGAHVLEESDLGLEKLFKQELGVETTLDVAADGQDCGDRLLVSGTIDPRHFNPVAWCYDTPGLKSSQQSINYLTHDQLREYMALTSGRKRDFHNPEKRFLLPRTFVVRPGLTMLLGRLGRLDVIEAKGPVYLTTQTRLPVHIVETSDVGSYWSEYALFLGPGTDCADGSATSGNSVVPPMTPVDLEPIEPVNLEQSVADVVLSGAGWVSVSGVRMPAVAEKDQENETDDYGIHLRAWTPCGVGISVRQPPLLPYAIRRRGDRLLYLREYSGLPSDAPFAKYSP